MGKYAYRARKMTGEVVTGEVEAAELSLAKRQVAALKLIVLEVKESSGAPAASGAVSSGGGGPVEWIYKTGLFKRVKTEDMMLLFQQLQTIYAVGIPLIKGLKLVASQVENDYLKKVLQKVVAEVAEGRSLSAAFAQHPDLFDEITISLLKAGESAGQLDEILERIGVIYQARIEQNAKIASATFYPKIVFVMIGVVFAVVVGFVIPKFKDFFDRYGGQLPFITRAMIFVSDFVVAYWYLIAIAIVGVIVGFKKFTTSPSGKRIWHKTVQSLPYFGSLFVQNDMVSFCSILEMLIRSGLPITDCFTIVKGSLINVLFQDEIETLKQRITRGETIKSGLDQSKVMPLVASNLIGIGEEAGSIEKALNRLGSYYKLQVEYKLSNLSKAIEPILLIFVFGMVLCLALAVFLPMWKMNSLVKK